MSTKTMLITTQGLKKVSREVINKRVFVSSKITKVGTPILSSDGIASGFTSLVTGQTVASYFKQDNLSFTNSDSLKIIAEGTFVPKTNDASSCLWSFIGTNANPLNLEVTSSSIQLCNDNAVIASISDLEITEDDSIRIELDCATSGCTIKAVIAGENVYTKTITFSEAISLTPYTSILVGVKDTVGTNYWQGSITLSELSIYKGDDLYYSPSIDNIFKFSKIIVCDASVTLTDSTTGIVNHCYELPVYEIKRSFNNILITSQIPSDAYLNINKIGLYSTGDDGTQLFALLDNLTIAKTKGLEYNLVLNVSIDMNVVNVLVMPNFVLSEVEQTKYNDFDNIRRKFTSAETDLERMIKANATEVGYNKPQVYYRYEDDIELIEDNYMAVRDFLRFADDFQVIEKDVFDYNKAVVYEPLTIQDSIASRFTLTNYLTPNYMAIGGSNSWEFVVPFTTGSNTTADQSIVSALSCNSLPPFWVYVSNGYCRAWISKPEVISLALVSDPTQIFTYIRNSEKTTINGTEYYFWSASDPTTYTIQMVYTTVMNPSVTTPIYYLNNGVLTQVSTMTFAGLSEGTLINKNIFAVQPFTKYYFKVVYNGSSYKFYTSSSGENYTIVDTESISTEMATSNNICIGIFYNGSQGYRSYPFLGSIDLSGLYLNKQGFETTGMILTNASSEEFTYNKSSGKTVVGTQEYYTWNASSTSYALQTVYTLDSDPISTSRLYKLVSGTITLITDYTFKELITVPASVLTNLTKTEVVNDSVLKDYFHIPTYNYSSYRVINLCNSNSKLEVLDCSLTGNKIDNIDFSGDKGFTLCTKVSLSELYDELEAEPSTSAASRIVLAKTSLGNTQYLNISLACNADKSLFTLSASIANGSYVISKDIENTSISSYVDNPILLTLTFNTDSSDRLLKFYKNNDLIASQLVSVGTTISGPTSTDMITNYLTTAGMADTNSCVSDIVFIDGPVSVSQLYYVTNLLDCNF